MLEVAITRGMKHGQKVTFRGEADETPGILPGDVIFVIEVRIIVPFLAATQTNLGLEFDFSSYDVIRFFLFVCACLSDS